MAELHEIYKDDQKVRQIAIGIFQMLDVQKQGFITSQQLDSLVKDMAAFSVIDTDHDKKIYL